MNDFEITVHQLGTLNKEQYNLVDIRDSLSFSFDAVRSIQKKFRKSIWCNFSKAVRDYELVKEGDRIAVCISGGKDSMLMAMLFQELKRHDKFPFDLEFLVMDPGYNKENRQIIESNAKKLNIPITVFDSDIFETILHVDKSPCYLCEIGRASCRERV